MAAFSEELRALRITCGNPSLRDVRQKAPSSRPLSVSAVSEAMSGKRLPSLDFLVVLVQTLLSWGDGRPVGRDDPRVRLWRSRWELAQRARVDSRLSSLRNGSDRRKSNTPLPTGATYLLRRTASASSGPLRAVVFSPDGCLLATAGEDRTVGLWDTATGQAAREPLIGHTGYVGAVAFSPDGRLLATASSDATVRLWDPHTGQAVREPLTGHTRSVRAVAFSPDGHLLATTSRDSTVRLWDPHTGQAVREPLTGHTGSVWAATFSPDGRLLATTGSDETVRLWGTAALNCRSGTGPTDEPPNVQQ